MNQSPHPLKRRFRFSLRVLFVATAIVGVLLALPAWYAHTARRQCHAVDAVEQAGGRIWYGSETEFRDSHFCRRKNATLWVPAWAHELMGIDYFDSPTVVFLLNAKVVPAAELAQLTSLQCLVLKESPVGDADVSHLARLTDLEELYLDGTDVTDDGVRDLVNLKKLNWLSLRRTHITDAGLVSAGKLTALNGLDLGGTNVTDEGLAHLAGLRELTVLILRKTRVDGSGLRSVRGLPLAYIDLGECQVSRDGVRELATLSSLEAVDLRQTGVTDEDITQLRQALPKCQIMWQ